MMAAVWAEWGKTWSVRAPIVTLFCVPVAVTITAFTLANDFLVGVRSGEHPASDAMALGDAIGPAVQFGMIVLAAFAMSLITAEYSTRTIAGTFAAQPRRWRVLGAKAAIVAVVGLVLGTITGAISVNVVQMLMRDHLVALDEHPILTGLRVGGLFATTSVLALGVAMSIRSAVGTLSIVTMTLVGTVVLPPSVSIWTPGGAAGEFITASNSAYPSAVGLLVNAAWAAAAYCVGLWSVQRRDA